MTETAPRPSGALVVVAGCILLIALSVLASSSAALVVAPVAAVLAALTVAHRRLLAWQSLLTALVAVVLFVPIRRYALGLGLPVEVEPYRLLLLALAVGWIASLALDPRVRLRRTGLEAPLAFGALAIAVSLAVNADRIVGLGVQEVVVKRLAVLGMLVLVLVLAASVVRSLDDALPVLKTLVAGAAVLGLLGTIESRTGWSPFDRFDAYIPFLYEVTDPGTEERGGFIRATASAQHPIAYGGLLAMLFPVAFALAYRSRSVLWGIALLLILLGCSSSVSRTAAITLAVATLTLVVVRREARLLLPAAVPLLLAVQIAMPGTFNAFQELFFPREGLVQEQSYEAGAGRVASLGPALDQWGKDPVSGVGFGSRVTAGDDDVNAFILDNEWLGILLETGVLGALAFAWLFLRFLRIAGSQALEDRSDRGLVLGSLAAAVLAYGAGMFFYDAFSFVQVTLVAFLLIGLGCGLAGVKAPARRRVAHRVPVHGPQPTA